MDTYKPMKIDLGGGQSLKEEILKGTKCIKCLGSGNKIAVFYEDIMAQIFNGHKPVRCDFCHGSGYTSIKKP